MLKLIILSTLAIVFFGCESSTYKSETINSNTSSLSGILVDGYIKNATLCLDKNLDGVCESDLSSVSSNENGIFTFSNIDLNTTNLFTVIANGGIDTSTQKNHKGELKSIIDTSQDNTNLVISPLTDLVAVSFLNADTNDTLALNDARSIVSQALGLSQTELYKNPMKDIKIFSKSQELQHTKALIQTSFEKRTSLSSALIEKKVKEELLNHSLNINQTLIAMEINLHTDLPQNEKTFIKNQIVELKNTLNSLAKDTSLAIENLNRIQKSIDIKQTEALTKLFNADTNDTLNVVEINTTNQSITQSIFNTTDATLDKQACRATNGYNVLKHSNFTIEKARDATNGIDLMSEYGRGNSLEDSQVQIFYPNLEIAKEDDSVVVFQDNYYFAFDKAWKNNTNKTIYIMTPKEQDDTYSCYKFELNFSVAPNNIQGTKVFRYQDI